LHGRNKNGNTKLLIDNMIATPTRRRQLLEFLISRWVNVISASAVEIIYNTACQFATDNDLPNPETPVLVDAKPCLQIAIIKHRIVQILPEAKFIEYSYEPPAPLNPKDYIEIYTDDSKQCAGKVKELIERLQVT
jgi:hypothetical protein